jgi:hypothetical protein
MPWYNPFSWFSTDAEQAIVDQAGHDVLLLAQMRADAAAGIVTAADYQALRETFLRVHGAGALAAFDASAPAVPAGATIGDIKYYLGAMGIDESTFQEPAREAAQGKIDDIKDKAVVEAVVETARDIPRQLAAGLGAVTSALPFWVKLAAIAGVALFGLHTLARLGVRAPRLARRRKKAA